MTAAAAQKLKNFLVHRRRRLEKQSFFLPIGGGGAIFSLKIGGGGGSAARLTPLIVRMLLKIRILAFYMTTYSTCNTCAILV
jgi:hypothetical protein